MEEDRMVRGGFRGSMLHHSMCTPEHGDGLESQSSGQERGLCVSPHSYVTFSAEQVILPVGGEHRAASCPSFLSQTMHCLQDEE